MGHCSGSLPVRLQAVISALAHPSQQSQSLSPPRQSTAGLQAGRPTYPEHVAANDSKWTRSTQKTWIWRGLEAQYLQFPKRTIPHLRISKTPWFPAPSSLMPLHQPSNLWAFWTATLPYGYFSPWLWGLFWAILCPKQARLCKRASSSGFRCLWVSRRLVDERVMDGRC